MAMSRTSRGGRHGTKDLQEVRHGSPRPRAGCGHVHDVHVAALQAGTRQLCSAKAQGFAIALASSTTRLKTYQPHSYQNLSTTLL